MVCYVPAMAIGQQAEMLEKVRVDNKVWDVGGDENSAKCTIHT